MKSNKKHTINNQASFSNLVNKYKNKISAPETLRKWYET